MNDADAKHVMDALSVLTVIGTLMNFLPHVAAVFTIIWTGIRIYETDTIQKMVHGKVLSKRDSE